MNILYILGMNYIYLHADEGIKHYLHLNIIGRYNNNINSSNSKSNATTSIEVFN